MRIVIVSDAWTPQVNGVVRTLQATVTELTKLGHDVKLVTPDLFFSIRCPSYPEIRLALAAPEAVGRQIAAHRPEAIHIATEGPLGLSARHWCRRRGHAFTTAYHTQFPDYLAARTGLTPKLFWPYFRWFHRPAHAVLASTRSVQRTLRAQGIVRTRLWGRGVDLDCFRPDVEPHHLLAPIKRPIQLYVGRVAEEKNIESFLDCEHAGSKVVVGDGPSLNRLKRRYPHVAFMGALHGRALASAYAAADVLVFPSRTDTFGLVMIEALACGTPVAAFPVAGPLDVLDEDVGRMDEDLGAAIAAALGRDRAACVRYAQRFSWPASARQFVSALAPLDRASLVPRRAQLEVVA